MTDTARRTLTLLAVLAAIAAPAVLLRALCVGSSCAEPVATEADVPFCSLPREVRARLAAGYRDGRSADLFGVTAPGPGVRGGDGYEDLVPAWPSAAVDPEATRVPLFFAGAGVRADVPTGTTLAQVAPTIADAIGLERPFPEVRSGAAIAGVGVPRTPRLVLLVVWKGTGAESLEASPHTWPRTRRILAAGGGTLGADVGALPADPAAILTTIGTGGFPAEHGITGSVVRNDEGEAVTAWGPGAPFSVIAALGDDLDEVLGQAPRVGIVSTSPLDRGLIGRDWYVEHDEDDEVLVRSPRGAVTAVGDLLATGYGADEVPDLLAVALEGQVPALDRATARIADLAARATGAPGFTAEAPVLIVLTGTGSVGAAAILASGAGVSALKDGPVTAATVAGQLEARTGAPGLVEAVTTGGLFLDQAILEAGTTSRDRAIRALARVEGGDGERAFADAFAGTAIEFGEFC